MALKKSGASPNELLALLEARFTKNMHRHKKLSWKDVEKLLVNDAAKMASLEQMEATGGEPDVIMDNAGRLVYCDCSTETPSGRRSLCYDKAAWDARKEARPQSSAMEMAAAMGVELLTEEQYQHLQTLGEFDTKTSSWLYTPAPVRALGGAIFGDRRYNRVFIYHNGAQSYYAARGFRAMVEL